MAPQSEESGIEPGHIATITGSLASFPDHDPDHYDTDHTDLASESDEAELRRVLLRDQWRQFFDKYDPEGFGEIPWSDLMTAMSDPEFRHRVGTGKREILLEKARVATTPAITFQDFVNVGSIFCVFVCSLCIAHPIRIEGLIKSIWTKTTPWRVQKGRTQRLKDCQVWEFLVDGVGTPSKISIKPAVSLHPVITDITSRTFVTCYRQIGALSQTRYSHFVSLSPRHRCPSSVPIGTIAHIQLAYQYGAIAQDSKYLLPVSTPEYFHGTAIFMTNSKSTRTSVDFVWRDEVEKKRAAACPIEALVDCAADFWHGPPCLTATMNEAIGGGWDGGVYTFITAYKDENSDLTNFYKFCIVLDGSETSELGQHQTEDEGHLSQGTRQHLVSLRLRRKTGNLIIDNCSRRTNIFSDNSVRRLKLIGREEFSILVPGMSTSLLLSGRGRHCRCSGGSGLRKRGAGMRSERAQFGFDSRHPNLNALKYLRHSGLRAGTRRGFPASATAHIRATSSFVLLF
ncbi:hypothetical protein GEV33_010633 [Tenebrio molitor]|uniref:EF-hand domain-containing protein n=1 Tax=Tenebrio molitor TaxID=7067 RepID=A0A8J6HD11_TENMO|nr:hypothetical protein GEV33_010633 [Tenebrio molitor]